MGIFGWDYPPGVNSLPWDEDWPCAICGGYLENCECPECPVCGDVGNPDCYPAHGLTYDKVTLNRVVNQEIIDQLI